MYRIISFLSLLILVCCTGVQPTAIANTPTPTSTSCPVQQPEQSASALVQLPVKVQTSQTLSAAYQLSVNYGIPLADMIVVGKYDGVHKDITQEHFPLSEYAKPYQQALVELHLVYFGRYMPAEHILANLNEQGLRPATLPELCVLGKSHPELQRKFDIMALGSRWRRQDGRVNIPTLGEEDGRRYLGLSWNGPDGGWHENVRFLVVSM